MAWQVPCAPDRGFYEGNIVLRVDAFKSDASWMRQHTRPSGMCEQPCTMPAIQFSALGHQVPPPESGEGGSVFLIIALSRGKRNLLLCL